jgi:hypothetical protein
MPQWESTDYLRDEASANILAAPAKRGQSPVA